MEKLRQAIQRFSPLSDTSWEKLRGICQTQLYEKNEYVLEAGAVCRDIYFVEKGLLRTFYRKEEKEISEWFAFEDSFCFSIISYFQQTPSLLAIQCLEDSEVTSLSREGLMRLKEEDAGIAGLVFALLSDSLILSQERMISLQFETALQRYEYLIRTHPGILQRVPLQHIASYLGVSAETLSRIRSQLH